MTIYSTSICTGMIVDTVGGATGHVAIIVKKIEYVLSAKRDYLAHAREVIGSSLSSES